MKTNKIKIRYIIAAAALFLAAATPTIDAKAQWDVAQNATSGEVFEKSSPAINSGGTIKTPFSETPPPSYALPPGAGDSQKEIPIQGGLWALIGLAISYGIFRRERRITN